MAAPTLYCVICSSNDRVSRRTAPCAGISINNCDVMALPAVDDSNGLSFTSRDASWWTEIDIGSE